MLTSKIENIKNGFKSCTNVLSSIGDETRQLIILALIDASCDGMRVGEIQNQTHLSRPAVSHHLKILKDAKVVSMTKFGTKNYYFLTPNTSLMLLKSLITDIEDILNDIKSNNILDKS